MLTLNPNKKLSRNGSSKTQKTFPFIRWREKEVQENKNIKQGEWKVFFFNFQSLEKYRSLRRSKLKTGTSHDQAKS